MGDFLDATDDPAEKLDVDECAAVFARLKCAELLFVPGNHEPRELIRFRGTLSEISRKLHWLEADAAEVGGVVLVGFPCFIGGYSGNFREIQKNPDAWLAPLFERHGASARLVWLMHEGPGDNAAWARAIARHKPKLVVHGHDHEGTRGRRAPGSTTVVNLGQNLDGPLRYTLIDLTEDGNFTYQLGQIGNRRPRGSSAEMRRLARVSAAVRLATRPHLSRRYSEPPKPRVPLASPGNIEQ